MEEKNKGGLAALITMAAAAAASGCYIEQYPYSYNHRLTRPVVIEEPQTSPIPPSPPEENMQCREFAASSADSRDPNGRIVRVCNDGTIRSYYKYRPPTTTVVEVTQKTPPPAPTPVPTPQPQCPQGCDTARDLGQIIGLQMTYIKKTPFGGSNEHLLIAVVRDDYLIACELLGRQGKQSTFQGVCYRDDGLDGVADAYYQGPVKKGGSKCKIDCLTIKHQVTDKRTCLPWKPIDNYRSRNQNYHNLLRRILHAARGG